MEIEELTIIITAIILMLVIVSAINRIFSADKEKYKLRVINSPKKGLNGEPAYIDIYRKEYTFLDYAVDSVKPSTHPTDVIAAIKRAIFVGMSTINHDAVKCHVALNTLAIRYKYINGNSDWIVTTPHEDLFITNRVDHSQHADVFYKMYLLGQGLAMSNFDTEYFFLNESEVNAV